MADLTLSDIVAKYGAGQIIFPEHVSRDFGVDDLTIDEIMSAPAHQFSPEWTPRIEGDGWRIASTQEVMAEALAVAANGSWTTWQALEEMELKHPCNMYLGTAIVMAAQSECFTAPDGTVYRASAQAPNRIKVWKE